MTVAEDARSSGEAARRDRRRVRVTHVTRVSRQATYKLTLAVIPADAQPAAIVDAAHREPPGVRRVKGVSSLFSSGCFE